MLHLATACLLVLRLVGLLLLTAYSLWSATTCHVPPKTQAPELPQEVADSVQTDEAGAQPCLQYLRSKLVRSFLLLLLLLPSLVSVPAELADMRFKTVPVHPNTSPAANYPSRPSTPHLPLVADGNWTVGQLS